MINSMNIDPRWREFELRHPGHPTLTEETIYAIPKDAIIVLQESRMAGKKLGHLLNKEEMRFESDLAELGGTGFFLKRPICYISFPIPTVSLEKSEKERELDRQQLKAEESIREMLREGRGASEYTPEDEEKRNAELDANLEQCRLGYAGWLVTDSTFCRARDEMRTRWTQDVESLGQFPGIPLTLMGELPSAPPKGFEEMNLAFQEFYQLWGLESFATWDLPIPMQAELVHPTLYYLTNTLPAGNSFFLPWFMMRAKSIGLQDLMRRRLTTTPPEHLLGWIEGSDVQKKFGLKRLAAMLRLYLSVELALRRRYPDRFSRASELLDEMFIDTLGIGKSSDSVRKVRLEMQKRLAAMASKG